MNGCNPKKLKCLWCCGGQTWSEANTSATQPVCLPKGESLHVRSHCHGKKNKAFVVFVDWNAKMLCFSLTSQGFFLRCLNTASWGPPASFCFSENSQSPEQYFHNKACKKARLIFFKESFISLKYVACYAIPFPKPNHPFSSCLHKSKKRDDCIVQLDI